MNDCSEIGHQLTTIWTRFNHQPEQFLSHLECKVCNKKLTAKNIIKIFSTILEEKTDMINELIE